MARIYAGILGPLAFLTSLAHGWLHARQAESILFGAWLALVVFSALGCVIGWIAGRTVEEEVRNRIASAEAEGDVPAKPAA